MPASISTMRLASEQAIGQKYNCSIGRLLSGRSNQRVGAAGDDGKPVRQFGQCNLVNGCGWDGAAAAVRQIAGGAAVGSDGGAEAEVERGARGGADAHMRHQAGEDDVLAPGRSEARLQV